MGRTIGSAVALLLAAMTLPASAQDFAPSHEGRFSVSGLAAQDFYRCHVEEGADGEYGPSVACMLLGARPLLESVDLAVDSISGLDTESRRKAPAATGGFDLGDQWKAAFSYRHELLSAATPTEELRRDRFSAFSNHPNRDVLDLKLSWSLPWSQVDLGYMFQSQRALGSPAGTPYSVGGILDSEDQLHAFMIGITKPFGGSD